MGVGGYAAYLGIALAALAATLLWVGLWPIAALALAFLVGGRREVVTLGADAIVFVGLAGHADPLWVALLVVASLATGEHDPRAILMLFFASIAATFVYVDWTILTGLLAVIASARAVFVLRRYVRRRELGALIPQDDRSVVAVDRGLGGNDARREVV